MMKRVIHWAAAGSVGLMIGSAAFAGDSGRRDHTSPACHSTYGYHQTCWRRFPALPPCETCDTCDQQMTQSPCADGSCQAPPLDQPQALPMRTQPSPMPLSGGHSMRYNSGQSPAPSAAPAFQNMQPVAPPAYTAPMPPPQSAPTSGRYQSHLNSPATAPLMRPQTVPTAPRPMPVPAAAPPANGLNMGLPPIPGGTPRSSGLYIPAQSRVMPGSDRYRAVGVASNRLPVHSVSQSMMPRIQSRYSVRPRPAANTHTQLRATPLLRRPVN